MVPDCHRLARPLAIGGVPGHYWRAELTLENSGPMAPKLAIIGAGMGGLTLAAALNQRGIAARIYEQAKGFVRLGAGIQMSPNAMRVLRGIGLEPRIRMTAFQPRTWTNRDWDSGRAQQRAAARRRGRGQIRRAIPPDASRRPA